MTLLQMKTFSARNVSGVLLSLIFLGLGSSVLTLAQNPVGQTGLPPAQNQNPASQAPSIRPNYILGSNDQILIRAPQVEEINERPFRIDADGFVALPLIGRVRAGGLTVQALETDVTDRLRQFIREPQVVVTVVQFHSEPVFVMGDFRVPGIYPLEGRTLVELLSSAGGTQPNASRRIKITRHAEYGAIPLPSAVVDAEKKISTVEVSLASLSQNVNPAEDIVLKPYDIVSVERAGRVYVSGEVLKGGAIDLAERDSIPVSQVLAEAGGFTQFASRNKVRVLRPVAGTSRRAEIDIDLKRIFEGKDNDFPLLPDDALYVPRASGRALLLPVGTSMLGGLPYIIITAILH